MKAIKRMTAMVLVLCVLLAVLPVTAFAAIDSGSCGLIMDWTLNDNGTLVISGGLYMYDYQIGSAPWSQYSEHIKKVVVEGSDRIGTAAFAGCYNLASVTLHEFVNKIRSYAFYGCTNLKTISLQNINQIGDYAFALSGLTSITIPSNVSSIGQMVFLGCSDLKKISVAQNNKYFSSDSTGVLFNKDKTELIQAPCGLSGSYTIPGSVTTIRAGAFALCEKVTEIVVPAGVTEIGASAFEGCTALKRITVAENNSNYSSDSYGVLFNKNKTELIQAPCAISGKYVAPGTLERIGDLAFEMCSNLTGITIPNSVTYIGAGAFLLCEKLADVSMGKSIAQIGESAFAYCYKLKNLNLPESLTDIGDYAFSECKTLKNISIPASVEMVGEGAFSYCTGLKKVTAACEVIGKYAFYGCTGLETVKLLEGVTVVYDWAFAYCGSMISAEFPKTLGYIYLDAFLECSDLATVFCTGDSSTKRAIRQDNDQLKSAAWHYECVALQGKYGAYYCGDCDQCYFLDGWESYFTDLHTNSWQFVHAKYAVENNLMAGMGTDAYGRPTFHPDNAITREEFVQVLYNAEGKPAVESEKVFPDVDDSGWYKNAVLWAYENNIASGLGDGSFGIGRNITRQDLAVMLHKYAVLKGYDLTATEGKIYQYADGSVVSGYAREAMNWAVTKGILSGKGTAGKPLSTFRLDPAGTATRAECAAMLRNFMTAFQVETGLPNCWHSYIQELAAKEANCNERGNIACWHCPECNRYFSDKTAATELTPQEVFLEITEHNWQEATCTAPRTCSICQLIEGEKLSHSISFEKTVPPTCGDQGYDLYQCANCDYTEKKNFTEPQGSHIMELASSTVTCTFGGEKTYQCKVCSYTTQESVEATGSHNMQTMTVAEAAPICAQYGKYSLQNYLEMTDVNITVCTQCGYADYQSVCSVYTHEQETDIFISLSNPLREEYMLDTYPDDGAARFEEYKHISDYNAIELAIQTAEELASNYWYSGEIEEYRVVNNRGSHNIQDDLTKWVGNGGYYRMITNYRYPNIGYARYIVGDEVTETITIYSVLLMGRREE